MDNKPKIRFDLHRNNWWLHLVSFTNISVIAGPIARPLSHSSRLCVNNVSLLQQTQQVTEAGALLLEKVFTFTVVLYLLPIFTLSPHLVPSACATRVCHFFLNQKGHTPYGLELELIPALSSVCEPCTRWYRSSHFFSFVSGMTRRGSAESHRTVNSGLKGS